MPRTSYVLVARATTSYDVSRVHQGGVDDSAVGHRDRQRRHAAPGQGGGRRDARDRRAAPGPLRPLQGQGGHHLPRVPGRPAARPVDPDDGAVADAAGGGQDHDHRRAHRRAARSGSPRDGLPARAVDGSGVRHEGRRGRRWLQPGRADDGHQPALHGRLRGDRRGQQPAVGAHRQPRAPRQRARHRRPQRHVEARARHERPGPARGHRRARRPRQRLPPRGGLRHRRRLGADGDLLPHRVVGRPEEAHRRHRHRLHPGDGAGHRPRARGRRRDGGAPARCAGTQPGPDHWRARLPSCTVALSPTSPTGAAR